MSPVCLTCGIITKSGKLSCCARGGSWFGKCGATGNAQVQHTWSEGIQVCKARQPNAVMGQQRNDNIEQTGNNSPNDSGDVITFHTTATTIMNTSVKLSERKSVISAANLPSDIPATGLSIPPVDSIDSVFERAPSAEASRDTAKFQTSASASIFVREREDLLSVLARISILLLIVVYC